ncbi:MAG: ABC transporter ATP-binding protein [Chloroflexi bacterium]|nr:ABC transporter ATP-binding protein [Chloroflexota bacterium]
MSAILRLTRMAWQHRWLLLLTYLCLGLSTIMAMAVPRLLGAAIDVALGSGNRASLLFLAGSILGVSVLRGAFSYGQSYLGEAVSQLVAYNLRNAIYDRLQQLSFAYHDRQQTGNLMSKATADVEAVRWFVSVGLIRSVQGLLLVGMVGALLVTMDWRLGMVSLAFVPLIAGRAIQVSRRLRPTWMRVQEETGHMTTVLQENLAGIRVVKAFGAEEHEKRRFGDRAWVVAGHTLEAMLLQASNSAVMALIFTAALGVILWLGGREVILGSLTPGELAQFILYMGILTQPVRMTGWLVNVFSRAASAGQRIFEVLDALSPVRERPRAQVLPHVKGEVHFEGVSFSYDSAGPALRQVNLHVKPGERVALLGRPGSGKSTLVQLIPRFYDVTSGHITIDGVDIRDVTLESLRRNVGIVQQDVFLFTATIRENIAYGNPQASTEEVVRAARVAQLHDFVTSLPDGYETWVGERGITLSGGQRQRLAIARTLLLDPPILVLDDSTSSVDPETEQEIQRALAEVMKGRTTFVIAHRLSTVQGADQVLVLDGGEIVERGSHQELFTKGGLYRQIYDLQLRTHAVSPARSGAEGDA